MKPDMKERNASLVREAFPKVLSDVLKGNRPDVLSRLGDYTGLQRRVVARTLTGDEGLREALKELARNEGMDFSYHPSEPPTRSAVRSLGRAQPARAYLFKMGVSS